MLILLFKLLVNTRPQVFVVRLDTIKILLFMLLPLFCQVSRDSPNETNRLRRERDELQSLVEKFEKHLTEVRNHCISQNIATDKDIVGKC